MPSRPRFLLPVLTALAIAGSSCVTPAHTRPALSVDVDSGTVIASHEMDRPWHPASVTKLMTTAVVLEAVRAGKVSLDTPVVFSRHAASAPPAKLGLKPGAQLALGDALRIMLTRSMNDVAVAIAESTAGDEATFARLMNLKAASLGMRGSRFVNASGLHDPRQVSTAADLAILARHILLEFPESATLFGIPSVTYAGKTLRNTNGLVGHYIGVQGMKTGYVCASGFNLVGLASRGSRRILTVVLGAPSARTREKETTYLFDQAFATASRGPTLISSAPSPLPAIDLRTKACGKNLRESFKIDEDNSPLPLPQPKPARRWTIAGDLEDYGG
ncbi:D-alanyl-D-alanine carboxypeptidase [Pararhizobium sp. BT-229]|uniref:D-alanyl-D-alanine carboxypeptidase family protein n=1 Tax=Pararhizobium sp. BT-229 TaxID=2986923 RepID=UPI0021F7132A|nr:D-alanyl-D-alanine carboxypeptidase family protein [Pararhizobium sp. BT-229]MCV9964580.1 D-alanyl-D-alanine carboxypeptidase [Pararhizobium sp. BT-229]